MKRTVLITAIISMVGLTIYSQVDQVGPLLIQLQSADARVRKTAFYKLQDIGISTEDRIQKAVIELLERENTYRRDSITQDTLQEDYATYYGGLIQAIATLKDSRALPALLSAIDTGNTAMNAIAEFGTAALDAVILKTTSTELGSRDGAVLTLGILLQPVNFPKISDPISKAKIRNALTGMEADPNVLVRTTASENIAQMTKMDVPGDVNGDTKVDCTDVAIVRTAFGKKTGQAGFDVRADLNVDGVVDIRDLTLVSQRLPTGTKCP